MARQLTDVQVEALFSALVKAEGCQWIGYDVPAHQRAVYCGKPAVLGKPYCQCHVDQAYVKNSALRSKRKAKYIEAEVREAELAALVADHDSDLIDVTEPVAVEQIG
jgi:hypothetical protein